MAGHPDNAGLTISEEGVDFIKSKESWRPETYTDPVGVLTIGWGTTGSEARPGRRITKATGERLLHEAEGGLDENERYVRNLVRVPLNQHQFDALVSLVFNMGVGNFMKSPVLQLLNRGQYEAAAQQMLRHNRGKVDGSMIALPGLKIRRHEEMSMFLTPVMDEAEVEAAPGNLEEQQRLIPNTSPEPATYTPTRDMAMNSRTFQNALGAIGGLLTAVIAMLKPLATNPLALAAVLISFGCIGAIIFFKYRETQQGR